MLQRIAPIAIVATSSFCTLVCAADEGSTPIATRWEQLLRQNADAVATADLRDLCVATITANEAYATIARDLDDLLLVPSKICKDRQAAQRSYATAAEAIGEWLMSEAETPTDSQSDPEAIVDLAHALKVLRLREKDERRALVKELTARAEAAESALHRSEMITTIASWIKGIDCPDGPSPAVSPYEMLAELVARRTKTIDPAAKFTALIPKLPSAIAEHLAAFGIKTGNDLLDMHVTQRSESGRAPTLRERLARYKHDEEEFLSEFVGELKLFATWHEPRPPRISMARCRQGPARSRLQVVCDQHAPRRPEGARDGHHLRGHRGLQHPQAPHLRLGRGQPTR